MIAVNIVDPPVELPDYSSPLTSQSAAQAYDIFFYLMETVEIHTVNEIAGRFGLAADRVLRILHAGETQGIFQKALSGWVVTQKARQAVVAYVRACDQVAVSAGRQALIHSPSGDHNG